MAGKDSTFNFIFCASARVGKWDKQCFRYFIDNPKDPHTHDKKAKMSMSDAGGKILCILCDEKQDSPDALQVHIQKHSTRALIAAGFGNIWVNHTNFESDQTKYLNPKGKSDAGMKVYNLIRNYTDASRSDMFNTAPDTIKTAHFICILNAVERITTIITHG